MAPWSFRVRFELPNRIAIPQHEVVLADNPSGRVAMRAEGDGVELGDDHTWLLTGKGFDEEESARTAANRWAEAVRVGFVQNRLLADFGDREPLPASWSGESGKELMHFGHDVTLLDDVPFQVYEAQRRAVTMITRGTHLESVLQPNELVSRVRTAAKHSQSVSQRGRRAYGLWVASHEVQDQDAAFLLLTMAVETLSEQQERPSEAQRHVDSLVESTRSNSEMDSHERQSLISSLEQLKRESVGQACRRLAATLGRREYGGKEPGAFFRVCYELRSRIVHGDHPGPTAEKRAELMPSLRGFVADLLQGEIRTVSG